MGTAFKKKYHQILQAWKEQGPWVWCTIIVRPACGEQRTFNNAFIKRL